jgi:hypothetical protein
MVDILFPIDVDVAGEEYSKALVAHLQMKIAFKNRTTAMKDNLRSYANMWLKQFDSTDIPDEVAVRVYASSIARAFQMSGRELKAWSNLRTMSVAHTTELFEDHGVKFNYFSWIWAVVKGYQSYRDVPAEYKLRGYLDALPRE